MMSSVIICCIIYGIFFVFMGGVFFLYSRLRSRQVKRELKTENSYIDVYKTAMENNFLLDRLERDEERSKQYPLMMEYLQQNRAIARKPFTFDHLEFYKRDRKTANTYIVEFLSCKDKEIRDAVIATSGILDVVYRQKHPVRAIQNDIKKNTLTHILPIVIWGCKILIKILEIFGKSLNLEDKPDMNENAPEAIKMEYTPKIRMQVA